MRRLIDAIAQAIEAKADAFRIITANQLRRQWELGYAAGYQRGLKNRDQCRHAPTSIHQDEAQA